VRAKTKTRNVFGETNCASILVNGWQLGSRRRNTVDHISHDVRGSTTLNYQPAILIKVGDGTTTRIEDAPAPKGRGVLLDGNEDIEREC